MTASVEISAGGTPLIRWSRFATMLFARLFTIGVVIQVFLAGASLFESAKYWDDHKSLGEMLGILPILLVVAAIIGRLPPRLIEMSVVLLILWVVQRALPEVDNGWIAALHPLNAFLLFGLSVQIGDQIRDLKRAVPGSQEA